MNKNVGKGWRPDTPDYRDKIFKLTAGIEVPKYMNNTGQSPVRDQGQEGSCVGHGVASCADNLDRTDETPKEIVTYSPRDIYYKARLLRGDENVDSGAEIRLAIKAIVDQGVCPDQCWPYRQGEFNKKPTALAKRTGKSFRVGSYERCDTLNAILVAIAGKHPVVGGFSCYSNMFSPEVDRTGVIPLPGGNEEGGHAVHFVGYNLPDKVLIFKNSWSERWGDKGYGKLPFYFVEQALADDFWTLIKEAV